MSKTIKPVVIEDAKIIFRNFSGKTDKYNTTGKRTFSVIIPEQSALAMQRDGWNVKPLKMRDGDVEQRYHLPVEVRFSNRPPKIVQVSGNRHINLTEDMVSVLDWADISACDISISPRVWGDPGNERVKAYLRTMLVTIEEDELEARIRDMDFAGDDEDTPF